MKKFNVYGWYQILHQIERKTNTSIRKLTKQWSWLMIGKVAGAIAALLLASAYARYLPQETYGIYKYILTVFALISIFTLQGMEDASQRAVANGKEAAFWDTLKLRVTYGSLTTLCSLLVGGYYYLQGNEVLGLIFIAAAPFLIPLNTLSHYNTLLLGRQLFKQISINNVLIQLSTSILMVLAVVLTSSIYWLVSVYVLSKIFFFSIGFIHTTHTYKPNNEPDPTALNYGKHMSIYGIVSIATGHAAPFLLWHFLGPVQLAVYAFALAAVAQMRSIFKLVTTTMAFPKISKLETTFLQATLPKKVLYAHCVTIPLAIALALIVPFVYQLLFPTYLESIIYAQAMTLLLGFSPMRLYSTALMAKGSPKKIHSFNVISSVLILGSLALFIPLYGIWGVVYSNIFSQFTANTVAVYLFKRM